MDVQTLAIGIAVGIAIAIAAISIVRFVRRQNDTHQERPRGQREVEASGLQSKSLDQEKVLADLRNRLALTKTAADTFAIYAALDADSSLGKEALEKAIRLGDGKLETATTVEECVYVINYIPKDDNPALFSFRRRVFEKAMLVASSTDDVINLLEQRRSHPDGNDPKLQDLILERALAVASSLEDAITVFEHATSESDLETKALDRIEVLASTRLSTETTVEGYEEILALLPDSEDIPSIKRSRREVILKILSLAETTDDALAVLGNYGTQEPESDLDVLILRRALALVTTSEEASEVYSELDEGSELEPEVLAVWTSKLSSVEECQQLWENYGVDTECGKLAILRAAQILSSAPKIDETV